MVAPHIREIDVAVVADLDRDVQDEGKMGDLLVGRLVVTAVKPSAGLSMPVKT